MRKSETMWGVIPAAGMGSRFGTSLPKQYTKINGESVLTHTIKKLIQSSCDKVLVVLAEDDVYWPEMPEWVQEQVLTCQGAEERCLSVLSGLNALKSHGAKSGDWVLVHDAARPCVEVRDINRLINTLAALAPEEYGAILAMPCRDTIKRVNHQKTIMNTIEERQTLWQALTPQVFQLEVLMDALHSANKQGLMITDEASAVEADNKAVKIIEGRSTNVKMTYPEDAELVRFILEQQAGI